MIVQHAFPLLLLAAALRSQAAPELRVAPGTDVSPPQVAALLETIASARFQPDWVEVETREAQITVAGHSTILSADGVKAAATTAPGLCRGEAISLSMSGRDFDDNVWTTVYLGPYGVYAPRSADPCGEARHRKNRFRIRGQVRDEELIAVLELIDEASVESDAAPPHADAPHVSALRLRANEKIVSVEGKVSADGFVIEVDTSIGMAGRSFRFRKEGDAWRGELLYQWIA